MRTPATGARVPKRSPAKKTTKKTARKQVAARPVAKKGSVEKAAMLASRPTVRKVSAG
jgi:hypothetical protein